MEEKGWGIKHMDANHIEEEISRSYINAVSVTAGMTCQKYDADYGLDGCINDISYNATRKRYSPTGFGIDFQLKATTTASYVGGEVVYDMEVKTYKDLIRTDIGRPRILVLYVMSDNKDEWVNVSKTETVLKRCAYWYSLRGKLDTTNKERVRIKIPESQCLDQEELKRIMNIVKLGGVL